MPLGGSTYTTLDEGNYIIRLIRLEDAEPGQFGRRMKWVFHVWRQDTGELVREEETGDPYEWWQTTSEATGPRSTARPWIEALLARKLPDRYGAEEMAAWCQEMVGKTAVAYVAPNQNEYTTILRIKPHVATPAPAPEASAPPAAAPAPAPVAAAAPEPAPAPAQAALNPDDLPFHHDPAIDGVGEAVGGIR